MPALMAKDADQVLSLSVALERIARCVPRDAEIMRGTFYGRYGGELELQFSRLDHVQMTVEILRCGLVHEIGPVERGELTGDLRRPHLWVGQVGAEPGGVPVVLWAYELIEELPEPEPVEGARFPDPERPPAQGEDGDTAAPARASA